MPCTVMLSAARVVQECLPEIGSLGCLARVSCKWPLMMGNFAHILRRISMWLQYRLRMPMEQYPPPFNDTPIALHPNHKGRHKTGHRLSSWYAMSSLEALDMSLSFPLWKCRSRSRGQPPSSRSLCVSLPAQLSALCGRLLFAPWLARAMS